MRLFDELDDDSNWVLDPSICAAVSHGPARGSGTRDVAELEHCWPPRAESARGEIEALASHCLNQRTLPYGLLTYENELRHWEIGHANLVEHARFHVAEHVEQLALRGHCHGTGYWKRYGSCVCWIH